ncbi:MAG TPA: dienelactone hydrolase family protein [Methylomirabilota bacterium]|jgi:carboxymethylenebutenolidase|nr:dienelactone hydrolase family protein [Methylomirabilota bacterium]
MAGKMVEFPSNGHSAKGYLATPAAGKGPGVIVIQEWWGLVGHIKSVCDRFAAAGYAALAPDLYHGQTASEPDAAGKLFMALNIERAEKDLAGAAGYLAPHSSTAKLGAVGFCMGGQLALFAGCTNGSVGAVVDFYGIHPNVKPDYTRLSGPVLGLFAEKDAFVTPQTAREVEAAIKKAGKPVEIHIYPGADHGFFNDERPDVYNKPAAEDAWRRTLDLFKKNLK